MKINGVEIRAESFPIRALYPEKSLIDLDWHIARVETTGINDDAAICRLGTAAMLAALNYSGDRAQAAEALKTTKHNAFRLIQFAAVAEHDRAVIMMARCYARGEGVGQDIIRAAQTLDVARKICFDGRYSKWIESVQDDIEEIVSAAATKALRRPVLQ